MCFNEKNQLCQANLVKYLILQIGNWRKTKTAKHQSAVRNICYPLATGRFGNTLHYCTIGTFSVALTNVFIKTNRIKFEPEPTLGKVAWWKCFLGISTISWSTQELARKGVPSHYCTGTDCFQDDIEYATNWQIMSPFGFSMTFLEDEENIKYLKNNFLKFYYDQVFF